MVKFTRILAFVLLFILLLGGCAPEYNSYTSCVMDITNDGVLSTAVMERIWAVENFDIGDIQEQMTVSFNGQQYEGKYETTKGRFYISAAWISYEFGPEGRSSFEIRSDTGQLSVFSLSADMIDQEDASKSVLENPRRDTQKIALELASEYIDTTDYKLEVQERSIGYAYLFTKYVGNLPTSDTVSIHVTEKGTVDFFVLGETGGFDNISRYSFSLTKVNKSIGNKVKEVYSSDKYTYIRHEIGDQLLARTPDNELAVVSYVNVTLKVATGEEIRTGVKIATIIK